ncbi:aminotransferase class I/II-fold pyridoxal phosphate-dependent enzyme [Pedobacter sp. P351]|uniref:trans-sulfuration enzyme family protein n=1 Tax=Pedobacter superstes TaxID=3133441 RepID=UPI0030A13DDE
MKLETIAIHAGNYTDPASGAVIQPITLSTTFERGEDGGFQSGYIYTRADNPNRKSLENVLSKLEGGVDACAFSSGNSAGSALLQALKPGSHIIAPDDMYHGLRNLINTVFEGILSVDYLDYSDLSAVESAIKPGTKLIWIETPSNPLLKISDIKALVKLAHENDLIVCCDNTFATPVFQRPLELGADIVMHSTTKYLGGHSDVLGGALITKNSNDLWDKIRNIQALSGSVPSPFDCYMTVRGIKTLPYRMRGHAENARQIASYLQSHVNIEKVFYPGLADHPSYDIAKSQMKDFGGMLSFTVKNSSDDARRVSNKLKLFTRATSLGGVESLIEHRASMEGPDTKTPGNLLRISVGLEFIDDLIADLDQALK